MTEAEEAYALAEKLIEEARKSWTTIFRLDREDMFALDRLPPQIGELNHLETLVLDYTQISDLSPISGLSGLRLLFLNETPVSDLSPLAKLTGLERLFLVQTLVSDLSPIVGLTALEVLSLDGTPVSDLSPIVGLAALDTLYLEDTSVLDLRPVLSLPLLVVSPQLTTDLRFAGCSATRVDDRIRKFSEITDSLERARSLFAYLENWEPPVEAEQLPAQISSGFQFNITDAGQLGFAAFPMSPEDDPQSKGLHDLLREEVALLLAACPDESQSPYSEFRTLVERYETALGADIDALVAPTLWNAGNKLRNEARSDALRSGTVLDEKPKLTEGLRDGLDAVLALHNAFVSGHPALSKLDATREDPVDRHAAALDPDQMQAFVDALDGQTRLIVETVIVELRDLHSQAAGTDATAARALGVERDSLENLINRAVREALIQQKGGALAEVSGHVTGAAVGAVTTGAEMALGPEVATSYPQLVQALQPHINTLLSMWHGADYPVRRAVDYLDSKQRLE